MSKLYRNKSVLKVKDKNMAKKTKTNKIEHVSIQVVDNGFIVRWYNDADGVEQTHIFIDREDVLDFISTLV